MSPPLTQPLIADPSTRRLTMGDDEKQAEIDRKKAEVRARLEAQAAGKKAKKGFMTPERKKKLRVSDINISGISPSNGPM